MSSNDHIILKCLLNCAQDLSEDLCENVLNRPNCLDFPRAVFLNEIVQERLDKTSFRTNRSLSLTSCFKQLKWSVNASAYTW